MRETEEDRDRVCVTKTERTEGGGDRDERKTGKECMSGGAERERETGTERRAGP